MTLFSFFFLKKEKRNNTTVKPKGNHSKQNKSNTKHKGVVRVQALKCSASEALNDESYNTLRRL